MRKVMKSCLIATAILCYSAGALAQNPKGQCSVRPMVGLNVSTFIGDIADIYCSKARLTGGFEVEYAATDWLGLSLGAFYSQQGAKADGKIQGASVSNPEMYYMGASPTDTYTLFASVDGHVHADYINFPLMANIYIPQLKGLALKVGLQVGALVNDCMEAGMEGAIIKMNDGILEFPFKFYTERTAIAKSSDFGIPVGLSYEYKDVVFDARYYFGLTKVDATVDRENIHNRCLSLTVGYRLHL